MNDLARLLAAAPPLSLAVAESVTCGHLQAQIGAISGISASFRGGITAYQFEQKSRHLGVDAALLARTNGVDPVVAHEMALGACRMFNADVALATTGYAEPSEERGVQHPFAYWAAVYIRGAVVVAKAEGRIVRRGAPRVEAQREIAAEAVAKLAEFLRKIRTESFV